MFCDMRLFRPYVQTSHCLLLYKPREFSPREEAKRISRRLNFKLLILFYYFAGSADALYAAR